MYHTNCSKKGGPCTRKPGIHLVSERLNAVFGVTYPFLENHQLTFVRTIKRPQNFNFLFFCKNSWVVMLFWDQSMGNGLT